jgi:hypothetical protein
MHRNGRWDRRGIDGMIADLRNALYVSFLMSDAPVPIALDLTLEDVATSNRLAAPESRGLVPVRGPRVDARFRADPRARSLTPAQHRPLACSPRLPSSTLRPSASSSRTSPESNQPSATSVRLLYGFPTGSGKLSARQPKAATGETRDPLPQVVKGIPDTVVVLAGRLLAGRARSNAVLENTARGRSSAPRELRSLQARTLSASCRTA